MKKIVTLVLFGLCVFLASCNEKPGQKGSASGAPAKEAVPPFKPAYPGTGNEERIKSAVVRYNELMAYGYRNLDMTPVQEVATRDQAEKAYIHMAAIGEGQARMISRLKSIDFDPVRFPSAGKAQVSTREKWDFVYVDVKTGVKKGEEKDFLYLVTYTLELKDGAWIITDIVATSTEKPKAAPPPRKIVPSQRGDLQKPELPPGHPPKPGTEPGF